MSHHLEMDWNTKWGWESFAASGSKATGIPKKLQLLDWTIVDDGEIDAGSFNLSTGGRNSGSGSDSGHVSSAKSSISASESSAMDGQTPDFRLMTCDGFSGNFNKGTKVFGTSLPPEASNGSVEPLNGLKLGKRTYFENSTARDHVKSSSSVVPTPSISPLKKTKSQTQKNPIPRCIVEGCNIELSTAKEYHRKHRVCDSHSKSPKVIVGGLECRFCQQCSRFHKTSEFDEKKRSCRKRLSDHNARRRKPQQDAIQFDSTRLSSPFYGGRQQMSFLLNNAPLTHSRNLTDTSWGNTCHSKFTLTKGCSSKSIGGGVSRDQMNMPGVELPHFINMQSNAAKGSLAPKSFVTDVSNAGPKRSDFSPHLDAAPEYPHALSLLSSNSWAPCGPVNPNPENGTTQPRMHGTPEGVPFSSSAELWLPGHQSVHPRATTSNSNFLETQAFITPYETDLYSNIMNSDHFKDNGNQYSECCTPAPAKHYGAI